MTVEGRAACTDDFSCLSGTGHPVAEDVGGVHGWEKLMAAYRTQRPDKEQREKREWFENDASNSDSRGLAGGRVNEWDMGKVNRELADLLPKLERIANQPLPTGEQMREHIMKQSREDIKRLWKD